jgi:hypothetical protein
MFTSVCWTFSCVFWTGQTTSNSSTSASELSLEGWRRSIRAATSARIGVCCEIVWHGAIGRRQYPVICAPAGRRRGPGGPGCPTTCQGVGAPRSGWSDASMLGPREICEEEVQRSRTSASLPAEPTVTCMDESSQPRTSACYPPVRRRENGPSIRAHSGPRETAG